MIANTVIGLFFLGLINPTACPSRQSQEGDQLVIYGDPQIT